MNIYILDEAQQDLIDGFKFYTAQSDRLGTYFLEALLADIESLNFYAGIHAIHFGYYRLLAKRFPFAIYYSVENKTVYIYAVLDCRRSPTWTRDRLNN